MSEYDHTAYDHTANSGNQALEDRETRLRAPQSAHLPGNGGVRRTQRVGLGSAIARHPFLVILPAIFLLAAGIIAGTKKHQTYSASATINVGKSDIITQATPGYVQAAQVLASSYSRVVMSQHVSLPVSHALGEPVGTVSSHLTAVPIPGEPTFTITATGSSQQQAIALANAAVNSIVKFANVSQTQQGSPSHLLARYTSAQNKADSLHSKSASLAGKLTTGVSGVTQAQVTKAQVASQVAALQAQAAGNAYTSLMENGVAPVLDVFNTATYATSNRTSNIEKYAVVGVVAGLVLGLALAALVGALEDRRDARRLSSLPA
jgi:capsular polysaccharide biosynthesis protein